VKDFAKAWTKTMNLEDLDGGQGTFPLVALARATTACLVDIKSKH
jgi:hypothetical protein